MNTAPLTRIEDAPLVCDLQWVARILNRSERWVREQLALDTGLVPATLPSTAEVRGRRRSRTHHQWSRYALEAWLQGDYLNFVRRATRTEPAVARRRFFARVK